VRGRTDRGVFPKRHRFKLASKYALSYGRLTWVFYHFAAINTRRATLGQDSPKSQPQHVEARAPSGMVPKVTDATTPAKSLDPHETYLPPSRLVLGQIVMAEQVRRAPDRA
jgi:hypothetical protein